MKKSPSIGDLEKLIKELENENNRLKENLSKANTADSSNKKLRAKIALSALEKSEIKLRESHERFNSLADMLPQTVWEANRDGFFTFINQYAVKEFGYTGDEVIGKLNIIDTVAPSERQKVIDKISTNPFEGAVGREFIMLRKDGSTFAGLVHYSPIIKNKSLEGFRGIITNIDNVRQIDQALEESNQRNKAILEAIPDLMFAFNRDGVFLDYNAPPSVKLYTNPKNFLSKNLKDVLPEHIANLSLNYINKTFETSKPQEYSYTLDIGDQRMFFDARMAKMGEDKVLCIVRDITEHKQAEEALRHSEENYHTIFQLANDSIIIHDVETGGVVDANNNAIQSYGLNTLEELREYGYWSDSPYGKEEALAWNKKCAAEGPQIFEWLNKRIDGTFFWEEVHLTLVTILGKERILSISRDITVRKSIETKLQKINRELKERNEEYASLNEEFAAQNEELQVAKEEAEAADRLKSAFLANMSHEIRTPMNAIMGFSSLLSNAQLTQEKQKHYSQIIKRRSSDLLKIIDDILDISKIEANQLTLDNTEGDVNKLLDEMLDYALSRVEIDDRKNLKVSLVNQFLKEGDIITDFGRLKQILFNLVENALKFTKEGTIEIGCHKHKDSKLLFYIKDSGIGIAEDKQEFVFDRFSQALPKPDPVYGGTGLGLAICKGLVELMGGSIWVESEIDKGSTFFFTIPLVKSSSNTFQPTKEEFSIYKLDINVLIIEDDELNASYLEEVLKLTGANFYTVKTGRDALVLLADKPDIKIVLLDIRLPDINGLEIIPTIKSISPNIKIIIQSAYATNDDKAAGFQTGCDAYLTKPVDEIEIIKTIQQLLT